MRKEDIYLTSKRKAPAMPILGAVQEISATRRKLYFAVFLVVLVFVLGAIAYHAVEGWDWLTSVYFISATMTTVGYGDVIPKTELGRVLTIIFIWAGISIGFYLIYTLSEFREKEVDERLLRFMDRIEDERKKLRL